MKDRYFTTSDGVRLHYLESGAGPTVVFVPGWMMPAEIWQPQLEYFRKSYHVVAVDPRSQGASDKPQEGNYPDRRAQDYKELIDFLGDSSVVMVGWSMGVYEALSYILMFGNYKLHGVVLVDLLVYDPGLAENREGRYNKLHNLQADRKGFAQKFVRDMYRRPQTEEYLENVISASLKTPSHAAVALLAELSVKNDFSPAFPQMTMPVLTVTTKANRSFGEAIVASAPEAQAEVFEDAGHCLFVDEADRFNTVLESFLQKASLGSGK